MASVSNLFAFDEQRSLVFLRNDGRDKLFNGDICPKEKLIFLEFSVSNGAQTDILNHKFPISILQVVDNSLKPVE